MRANKKPTRTVWSDVDDAPDLSMPKWKAKLAAAPVKRGRPKAVDTKLSTTIRIDRDVLSVFKKGGAGWQTRINAALRDWILVRKAQPKRKQVK
jgi:uncharacterized protein (DUF4415 family)